MLVVKVELYPYGLTAGKRVLAEARISNRGRDKRGYSYRAEINEAGEPDLDIPPIRRTVEIHGYDRRQSVLTLLRLILEELDEGHQQEPLDNEDGSVAPDQIPARQDLYMKTPHWLIEAEIAKATAEFRIRMARAAGGLLDIPTAAARLGWAATEVRQAIEMRQLLGVEAYGEVLLPECQFTDDEVLPGIEQILSATPSSQPWRVLQYLLIPEDGLAGRRPIDLIQGTAAEREIALRFAARLEE
jgi:hypothetical protein